MSATHLHLMFNHLPVLGTPLVLALLLWGLFRRSRDVQRTALGAAVIVAALSYPVFLTGEPAEERVEDAAWMQERMVHEHEERAEAALIAIMITGAVALVTLWQSRGDRPVTIGLTGLTAAGLLASAGLFGWAALAGGVIRHDEIRAGTALAPPAAEQPADGPGAGGGDDDGDDD
ncbi:MAG: hypothetical protein KA180_02705 [Gemmatimonadales bacterium]|jgi:hypothetical protein|nr:hypothetical protein [Gemmatimonadota bacterium]MBK9065743.1 hypothetical protein [Gemmatimonadota bacterium]MBP6668331.1 hypothetical protein [Gemmatimonadales bacterium]MBP9201876.1 hypothetical protein [Gemmatimonadales bacterium]